MIKNIIQIIHKKIKITREVECVTKSTTGALFLSLNHFIRNITGISAQRKHKPTFICLTQLGYHVLTVKQSSYPAISKVFHYN